ncbi:MAG: MFS transporter [Actinobacteria bacterium]|nr:MFS transporter [Actinomycetota bacterium]
MQRLKDELPILIARFIVMLGAGVLMTSIPIMMLQMKRSSTELGLVLATFGFAMTFTSPFIGKMNDRFDRKTLTAVGLVGFGISLALFAWSTSISQLLVGRIVQGFTAALVANSTITIVAENTPSQHLGTVMGRHGSSMSAGLAVGPLVGGFMANYLSPTAPIYLCAFLALASAVLIKVRPFGVESAQAEELKQLEIG